MMKDWPDHPLDLNKLVTLPPEHWTVSLCEDGVVIGAWVEPFDRRIFKRFFTFTVYPGEDAEQKTEPSE